MIAGPGLECRRCVMVGNGLADVRIGCWTALCLALLACSAVRAEPATPANNCPGHPDAIGTSRTLVVDPRAHPRIGSMQYPETLPLQDKEVVLTFDDGPLPRNSDQVLKTLADNCVLATFFTIGEQAKANPEGVRKLVAAGHTVGTHSQRHPLNFHRMSEAQAKQEVEQGIESTKAAMVDPKAIAPFFRIPGLLRAPPVEAYLESQGLQTWSTDFLADDWHRISSTKVHDLAMKRMDEMGKGILLLHDIQARTAAALPNILRDMKARGYKIVHVVAATPDMPATPSEPEQWQMHPPSETKAIARWPKLPNFVYADADMLAVPAVSNFELAAASFALVPGRGGKRGSAASPKEALWPRTDTMQVAAAAPLAAPADSVFAVPEKARAWLQPFPVQMHHFAEGEVPAGTKVATSDEPRGRRGRGGRHGVRRVAHAAPAEAKSETRSAAKPAAQRHAAPARPAGGKRSVHIASLKKRRT
jgi:peptidoglycan-N-acetylglucosamine deacetylase